jgi:hypothetical protein
MNNLPLKVADADDLIALLVRARKELEREVVRADSWEMADSLRACCADLYRAEGVMRQRWPDK